ncbi:protein broad-minded isoform X6 [Carettochelys insculpta]|uniref:protein broad-minded isoform X6 n=1 Tax=Carettochelys insculpta TaxID=44489 RepID=UPI003EBF6E71
MHSYNTSICSTQMSHFSCEDEALLQSMLRQLLQSVKEKITGAPSVECAEEILLHLEETDENFHNYEFVKYLRQYLCSTLGTVIEEETEKCISAQNQGEGSGYDTLVQHVTKKTRESKEYREMMYSLKNVMMVVVESLINKFEEDQMRNKEMHRKTKKEHNAYNTDNCSDSDSSFNQSYTFMTQEQLQLLVERLDPAQPKEVRQEAVQTLCSAPPSDVLNCESWPNLRKHLTVCLSDPDSMLSDKILRFYAKTFSSSPLNMTREVYTSLVKHLELYFLCGENFVPTISDGVDITNPEIIRLLKKVRLLNEYQREVPSFWIRHPEKYMEEIVETTLMLLSVNCEQRYRVSPKLLDPVYFFALLDIKAVWFQKWMHANYSRTVVLRLLENKYKSLASLLSERIPTPVPGGDAISSGNQESQNIMIWEETLLDDLLHFAATPKGLLLLQNTGALNECVNFMFSRFSKKIQVSGCERFDYGVMITQMAATSPGAVALQHSGFIKAIITELWAVLECGRDDLRVNHPSSTPVDPIDRSCQKSFLVLVNLLSYPAIYELIGNQELPNKPEYSLREVPTNVIDVIDRLIILNSEAKIHSLFSYEQSHIFGLRLLSVLCCDLGTLILLESQYKVSQVLLNAQKGNVIETSEGPGNFIIDGLSIERNHVLVRINLMGGPTERILPQRVLNQGTDPYPWPMFSSYPLPQCYLSDAPRKADVRQDNDLSKLLASLKNPDKQLAWIENCRRQFCKIMKTKPDVINGTILAEIIEKFVLHLSENPSECYFSIGEYEAADVSVKKESLSSVQQLGIEMTVRYGKYLNLLKDGAENDLCLVLMHCDKFLKQQQTSVKSSLRCLQEGYIGYDWFASSVFLIMSGDRERTLTFLQQFSNLLISAFLWLPRLHVSLHLPIETVESGIHPVYFCSAHYIEMLLKAELPLVFSAFHMSGFTPSQICQQWLSQCFWNYLDWSEICHYIVTCIFLGPDYQIYMCISVFKHLQQNILQHTQTEDLQVFLKEEALHRFRVSDYLEYMESLESTYRPVLLREMRNIRMQST